jgi:formiminotetrahydrofolate cyclodeaminase
MAMTVGGGPIDTQRLAEAVRQACIDAAASAYEDASLSGLCHEGAWEVAVGAIRSVDLSALAASPAGDRPRPNGGLRELTAGLSEHFASPGPPGAGSAAAATGAIAAGLLEWAAALSERRGPQSFGERAHTIARRAAVLRSSLASAGQEDAEVARALFGSVSDVPSEARCRATDSLLEIAMRCSQTATLAAEVAALGHRGIRPDVRAALQRAWTAPDCALALADEKQRSEEHERRAIDARRRAWRARLLLLRAAPFLRDEKLE